tara:strand:- start:7891 stop:8109 length:219 start_codon:yes stop_codon:yes gene_type:complete
MTTEKKKETKDKKSKADLEAEVAELTQRLVQVSEGYQNLVVANQSLSVLVVKYEETINLLTSRIIEARQQQG